MKITKQNYKKFVERLTVAGDTKLDDDWVICDGQAPHKGGSEEAAFAINIKSGKVFGAMLEKGTKITGFGFGNSWNTAPEFLQEWRKRVKNY